jgi:tyrosinase
MAPKERALEISRRSFLATSAVAAVGAALPSSAQTPAPAPSPQPPTTWTRVSLTDPQAPAMLASYERAIAKLLALDPNDPRNWYRNCFIHTLDCPHGNWWFPPWHRGYLGWWEQTVREFSGDPNFAFPYWDWTAQPYVPNEFWKGLLNPANPAYISNWTTFQNTFTAPMNKFYANLSAAQTAQLQQRNNGPGTPNFATAAGFWANTPGMFFPPAQARSLTQSAPYFDAATQKDVSIDTICEALSTKFFSGPTPGSVTTSKGNGFGSPQCAQHSMTVGFGIMEGLPHNNVHNDVGGFMGDFFSPVDPIFMMHHSNIDRLWSLWAAMQQQRGLPTLPTGAAYTAWAQEQFLFYINSQGQQVTQNHAGDYATIGQFNYTYSRGSGADCPLDLGTTAVASAEVRTITSSLVGGDMNLGHAAVAEVAIPADTLAAAGTSRHVHAHVTIEPPADPRGVRFHVFVNPPANANAVDVNDPSYAGTFEFFGSMHHSHPTTFTVPLTHALRRLRTERNLGAAESVRVHVIPQTRGVALRALAPARVSKVEVTAF